MGNQTNIHECGRLRKWTIKIFVPFLLFLLQSSYCQTIYTTGSSYSNSFTVGSSIPTNHFTGIPNISIPLFSLPGRALGVPISLSYHSGGHKVNEIANWVGLGWNLNVGGVITRVVRGIPDEALNGYCGYNNRGSMAGEDLTADATNYDYLENVQSDNWDGQPDQFYFNVMGISGSFILDDQGYPYTLPTSNIKIESGICGGSQWVITDESGTRYIFENTNSYQESSTVRVMGNVVSAYTSAWYLSKIETANQTEEINFTYVNDYNQIIRHYQSVKYEHMAGDDDRSCLDFNEYDASSYTTVVPKIISGITSALGSVSFIKSYDTRLDYPGIHSLSRIEVFDNSSNLIRSFWLNYGYFYSNDFDPDEPETRRLKLESIYDEGRLIAKFDYDEAINLPSRSSTSTDHWGFYGSDNTDYPKFSHPIYGTTTGSVRTTNSSRVIANLIKKITYGSGASLSFSFEANQYYDQSTSSNQYAGGARIAQLIADPGVNQPTMTTTYEYVDFANSTRSSGILYAEPLYYEGIVTGASGSTANDVILRRYMSPANFLTGTQGVRVGYSNVSETTGIGKIKYTYEDLKRHSESTHSLWKNDAGTVTKNDGAFDDILSLNVPFVDGWAGGLLKKKEILNSNGEPVTTEVFEYDYTTAPIKNIYGVVAERRHFSSCIVDGVVTASYKIPLYPILKVKDSINRYDPSNTSIFTTDIKEYNYSIDHPTLFPNDYDILVTSTESYNFFNPSLKFYSYFLYPKDYDVGGLFSYTGILGGIEELSSKKIRTIPIETYQIIDDNGSQILAGASYQTFQRIGTSQDEEVYPHEVFRSTERVSAGNYIPSHKSSTVPFEFVPGNVDFELVSTSSFTENSGLIDSQIDYRGTTIDYTYDGLGLLSGTSISNDLLSRSTSINLNPFTGPSSSTDANSRTASFTYDKKQRLSTIIDDDNNVMERKRYVSSNNAAVLIDGPESVDEDASVTLYASDPFAEGSTTFNWDMDDGNTYSTTNRSISHTYTTGGGVKSIKVTATNNEASYSVSGTRGIAVHPSTPPPIPPLTVGTINSTVSVSSCTKTLTFSITASGSCSTNYYYYWSYRIPGGSWTSFVPTSLQLTHYGDISLEVKVTVENPSCSMSTSQSTTIFLDGCFGHPDDY